MQRDDQKLTRRAAWVLDGDLPQSIPSTGSTEKSLWVNCLRTNNKQKSFDSPTLPQTAEGQSTWELEFPSITLNIQPH